MEVVVGVALVALTVGALYAGMTYGMQRTHFTREELRATQILLEKMEQLRLYRWDQLNFVNDPDDLDDVEFDPEDPHVVEDELSPFVVPKTFSVPFTAGQTNDGLVYYGTFSLTNAPVTEVYSNQLLLVTATLTWQSGGKTRTRKMQTFFAKYGLQNNIPE